MNNFSLVDKINILMKAISSSSFFVVCAGVVVVLLFFCVFCVIKNAKINKWLFCGLIIPVAILLLINYGEVIFNILDSIIDSVFMALYFPSLPIYASIILISNVSLVLVIFKKRKLKTKKIINLINTILLDFLMILVIDIVSKNNINIYEDINLYTDSTLLVLLELSMGIFVSWLLINLVLSAKIKLQKFDKKENKIMPEIIFD